MEIHVQTDIVIQRRRTEVVAYSADPKNAPEWYVNIKSAKLETAGPLRVGSRITFHAHFLGRRMTYTYQIVEMVPERRIVMRTDVGKFPMETSYAWEDASGGMTRMTLRNRTDLTGFAKFFGPFIERSIRNANRKDLLRLKHILEQPRGR